MAWLVLVNSRAGTRPVSVDRVRKALAGADVEAELEDPSTPAEMAEAITRAADVGRTHLAVVGGDGTVNLAVNTLLAKQRDANPILGILPAGTGCDLLRTFGLPQRLEEAAVHLGGDATYTIDVGRLEGRFGVRRFVNVAQAGVGAAAAETARKVPKWMGKGRYPAAFLVRLPRFPSALVELDAERRSFKSPALAVIIANGQFFAGGWNVAPRASSMDGLLDVQVINAAKLEAPRLVPKIIRGVHLTDRALRRISVGTFELRTSVPWLIEADGDVVGNTPVKVAVERAAIVLKI
jgi:YegS/Rv2252/BmrU family lipid kinase